MIEEKPLISVCIPAFNRPEFMSDLLDTIVSQNFRNFEIVVCEDNSPKSCEVEEVVNRYINKHVDIDIYLSETQRLWVTMATFVNLLM